MVVALLEGLDVACCRMLSVWDRAAMMVGLEAGLPQVRIVGRVGRSPSVVCREIARHTGALMVQPGQGCQESGVGGQASACATLIEHTTG